MSAFDPKKTFTALSDRYVTRLKITIGSAYCPTGHASSDGPNLHHDSAGAPSDHANNVAPTARLSDCRECRSQSQEAVGSVPRERCLTQP